RAWHSAVIRPLVGNAPDRARPRVARAPPSHSISTRHRWGCSSGVLVRGARQGCSSSEGFGGPSTGASVVGLAWSLTATGRRGIGTAAEGEAAPWGGGRG